MKVTKPSPIVPLRRLELTNFRGIEHTVVELDERVTVLFGSNAAGKTSILDALAISMGPMLTRIPRARGRRLVHAEDLRWSMQSGHPSIFEEDWEPVSVQSPYCRLELQSLVELQWSMSIYRSRADRESAGREIGLRALNATVDALVKPVLDSPGSPDSPVLPLVAFYGNARAVVDVPMRDRLRRGSDAMHERLRAYDDALTATTQFRTVFEWFRTMESEERDQKVARRDLDYQLPQLQWVRMALGEAIPRLRNPRVVTKPIRMLVDFQQPDGTWQELNVRMLSDGFRTHFALVADIARRMVQLNPSDDLTGTSRAIFSPALILIDEVDLHLDPLWQTSVVSGLLCAFPNAQFVVSTHSEQVIGSVHAHQVRQLAWVDGSIVCRGVPFAQGATGERILIDLMGAPERVPGDVTDKLNDYLKLIDYGAGRTEDARTRRHELDGLLPNDERLYQADLEMQRQEMMAALNIED